MPPRVTLALALAAALVEMSIAWRWHDAYFGAVAVGWIAALLIGRGLHPSLSYGAGTRERWAGALIVAASVGVMLLTRGRYQTFHRVVPLATGFGLALLAFGVRRIPALGRTLIVLGLAIVHPLPVGIGRLIERLPETATLAEWYLRAFAFPVERVGTTLYVPGSAVEVGVGCGGIGTTSLLVALAILSACVFRATLPRAALLVGSAVAVGFVCNAGRVACLAVLASRAPHLYDHLDGRGFMAPLFTVPTVAVALLVWWVLLRRRRDRVRRGNGLSAGSPRAAATRLDPIR